MRLFNKILLLFLLCPFSTLLAQLPYSFQGIVQNTDGEPLAFVAILPNDDVSKGVLSNIEGRFSISSKHLFYP